MTVPTIENRTRGILWMLATMFCFLSLDTVMKKGLESMSLIEVTWGRFFFATVFAALVAGRALPQIIASQAPRQQLLRSVFLMVTTGLFNAGIMTVPLATATTIMFMAPILVTLLSIFMLGEHVGPRRWASIAVGFVGATIVVQPWSSLAQGVAFGTVFLLMAAFTNALYQIVTRKLRHDNPLTSLLFTAAAGAAVTTVLLPSGWTGPGVFEWCLLVGSGALGCIGHLCLIRAFHAAPASVVAPFSYSSLIWAILFGFTFWREVPTFATLIGAVLIIGSGLYIFFRERKIKEVRG